MNKVNLIPGNTLIFLDEIQKCASARTALKFLAEDDRYDVISSGSLLGLHYGDDADPEVEKVESVPVGYEQQITMYSMDFEEYLWANEYTEEAIGIVRAYYEKKEKVPELINEKYKTMLREYSVVGGMPEVVASFCEYRDFGRVQQIQEKILAAYDDDIAYHAKGEQKTKVRNCYRTIPSQLARENKKFKYSEVEKRVPAGNTKTASSGCGIPIWFMSVIMYMNRFCLCGQMKRKMSSSFILTIQDF